MYNCYAVVKVPNRHNIRYDVRHKPNDPREAFKEIISGLQQKGRNADRCIIFCRTYDETVKVHECIADELGCQDLLFIDEEVTCEMFTSSSHEDDKSCILSSFTNPSSVLRVVVATIAFGKGIDAPNVRYVIHWGPPKTVEGYVQESGRCGRDGKDASAVLYFIRSDFSGYHPPSDMVKEYCLNKKKCRRDLLMNEFDRGGNYTKPTPFHRCCDVCTQLCECEDCLDLRAMASLELELCSTEQSTARPPLPPYKQDLLKEALHAYRISLLSDLTSPPLFGLAVATGITDTLIADIVQNTYNYTCVDDLLSLGVSSSYAGDLIKINLFFLNK